MSTERLDVWQQLLADPRKSLVLFEHGTCVVLTAPDGELAEQATDLLRSSARRTPDLRQETLG
ncbi:MULTISPECIES: hypothetical protein [unclassified Streptomyces]|uniref:hypothetical protein n=1 Tax=unclassified Streptomyces TaxID=2593676 RepID=UPI0034315577